MDIPKRRYVIFVDFLPIFVICLFVLLSVSCEVGKSHLLSFSLLGEYTVKARVVPRHTGLCWFPAGSTAFDIKDSQVRVHYYAYDIKMRQSCQIWTNATSWSDNLQQCLYSWWATEQIWAEALLTLTPSLWQEAGEDGSPDDQLTSTHGRGAPTGGGRCFRG